MMRQRDSVRRGVRTLVQSVWGFLVSVGVVEGTEIPELYLLALVPILTSLISLVANEWEGKGGIRGFASRLASGIRKKWWINYG